MKHGCSVRDAVYSSRRRRPNADVAIIEHPERKSICSGPVTWVCEDLESIRVAVAVDSHKYASVIRTDHSETCDTQIVVVHEKSGACPIPATNKANTVLIRSCIHM